MSTSPGVADVLDEQHRHIADLFDQVRSPEADRPAVLSRWDRMRDPSVTKLPPTGEARREHIERVRYETEAWKATRRERGQPT